MHENDIDDRTWRLLMDRLDSIESKVDNGFSLMNGRVRFTEKMIWTAFGGIGVVSIAVAVIFRIMKI